MTISIPKELYAFRVTSKDYDERGVCLLNQLRLELMKMKFFLDLFPDLAEKAGNYEILQILYLEYG